MSTLTASCRCGGVELRIEGTPIAQFYCHCDDCQAAHSAAYVAESIYPAAAVQLARGEALQTMIRHTPRLRCGTCGQHLFAEIASVGLRSVNAYLLPPGQFQPRFHVQCQHAVLPVLDQLPHFKAFPAAFGGADELVDW